MHQQEPSALALPHSNAVPQRSQTRLRRGRVWAADAGLMVLPSDDVILPWSGDGFNNAKEYRA
jgi:hypothetical protein